MGMKKWLPHVFVLSLLSIAEAARLYEFFNVLTGNQIAGIASAIITVAIVFYLAFYGYLWTSRWATLLCVILSLASFISPLQNEFKREKASNQIEALKEYPQYDRRQAWTGKETYEAILKKEMNRIDVENENIMLRNSEIRKERELSLYFWHLVLGAIVLGICVPVLNYMVSHKIAELNSPKISFRKSFDWHAKDETEELRAKISNSMANAKIKLSSEKVELGESNSVKTEYSSPTARPPRYPKKRKYDDSPSLPFPFMEGYALA